MSIQFIYKSWSADKGIAYAWWQCMHTRVDMIVYGHPEEKLRQVANEIEQELNRLEKTGSYYDTGSELHQVNERAALAPVQISEELYRMIDSCISYHPKTLGYFDAGIQSDEYDGAAIQSAVLEPENKTVSFKRKGIRIDLSGYLKGYSLDRIKQILIDNEVNNALINMGNSSALALGNHPHGEGWKVSFGNTSASDNTEILLFDECLTTSGNDSAGRKHIINPSTGEYVAGKKQVSVITPSGTDGEVLATALFASEGKQFEEILSNFPQSKIISNY